MSLRCRLGFHCWRYWRHPNGRGHLDELNGFVDHRACQRCGEVQRFTSTFGWPGNLIWRYRRVGKLPRATKR